MHEEVGLDMDRKLRDDLDQLVQEGKQKVCLPILPLDYSVGVTPYFFQVHACEGAGRDLHKKLSTVQERADAARNAVEEIYNTYLEILARRRDEVIKEIGQEHNRVEEEIMNTFSRIGNMSEKINDALR